jgi:hypothetical protein
VIDARKLLSDLQAQQKKLETDLREQIASLPELKSRLQADYKTAFDAGRTADTFNTWRDNEVTQGAVAWLLACTFVRFCEDNNLIAAPLLAGSGDALRRAKDAALEYFRQHPTENERHYLQHCFDQMAELPVVSGLFERAHNPLFGLPLSFEAARSLLVFWQKVDPDSGELLHDFRDASLNTRFLGDLYQDLSEAARKRYALLQTPEFVEEFILDRTLEPAIKTFGLKGIRLIDPTCGSGHFLLGAFERLLAHWQKTAPGLDSTEHVKHALDGVYGVDLNPFAVAIARFRLLVAALKASGIRPLKDARGWTFHLTTGDSLLHGRRFDQLDLGADDLSNRYAHAYAAEDLDAINRILGQQYHAVVGNPPYITANDSALNALYRVRYQTCHRKFSLGVPFTERFFQLALPSSETPAGYVGLITADSFMKREFGKKLIEDWLPQQDLTHLIHTSGAYIPGHGTPTVILLGRNRKPVADSVRAVLGIRGEPSTPADPARGLVWLSILELTDQSGCSNDYVSVADMERSRLESHPWSLQGGGAPEVLEAINASGVQRLSERIDVIGRTTHTGEDDVFYWPHHVASRAFPSKQFVELIIGEDVRDWRLTPNLSVLMPYDLASAETLPELPADMARVFWNYRATLRKRRDFGNYIEERGLRWYEQSMFFPMRYKTALSITFAFVATHNHFVLDRGGKVFKQSAPVIKLPVGASEDEHLALLGLLNSSTACFWMKQTFHNKGDSTDSHGARVTGDPAFDTFEFTGTGLLRFPLPEVRPLSQSKLIDRCAQERAATLPAALVTRLPMGRPELSAANDSSTSLLAQLIALQEELDWWCYRAYGLLDKAVCSEGMPPEIHLGERAFEIVLARRIAAGETQSTWFKRHGSTPITELPAHWPADYHALVERRIALIESNDWIGLLERPEYKRRWNQTEWDELEQAALKDWLLDRLETARYWPEPALLKVADLAAHAERDADFMAVAALYTAQPAFDVPTLIRNLLHEQSVPALKVLRYKEPGLRKRADWELTWTKQREEDAIDADVASEHPRHADESDADWQARLKPEQDRLKAKVVGKIAAPPKFTSADFLNTTLWRLRGGLDVPKERCFSVPDPAAPGESLYGWAGWNPAQRVRALAGAIIHAEQTSGADPANLIPLLAAIHEELPWVLQWHNAIDPEMDIRPGDYFKSWLSDQLNRHGWTLETLNDWRPAAAVRGRRTKKSS